MTAVGLRWYLCRLRGLWEAVCGSPAVGPCELCQGCEFVDLRGPLVVTHDALDAFLSASHAGQGRPTSCCS